METTLGQAVPELQTEIWEYLEKVSSMLVLVLHSCFLSALVLSQAVDQNELDESFNCSGLISPMFKIFCFIPTGTFEVKLFRNFML